MANVKISEMDPAASVVDGAMVEITSSSTTYSATFLIIWNYIWAKSKSASSKATPVDADSIVIVDTESDPANDTRRLTLTNLKAYLLTWLQGLFTLIIQPVEPLTITTGATTPSITKTKGYLAITGACEIQLPVTTSMANSTSWEYGLRILHDGTNVPTMAPGWRVDANDVSAGIPFSTDASAEDYLVLVVEKDASGNLKTFAGLGWGDVS